MAQLCQDLNIKVTKVPYQHVRVRFTPLLKDRCFAIRDKMDRSHLFGVYVGYSKMEAVDHYLKGHGGLPLRRMALVTGLGLCAYMYWKRDKKG